MAISYKAYKNLPVHYDLISTINVPLAFVDFGILIIAKFLEPHEITWYKKGVAGNRHYHDKTEITTVFGFIMCSTNNIGKILVALLMGYAFFMINFFQSNLRSTLISNQYEKSYLSNNEEIIQSGKRIYSPIEHQLLK